MDWLTQRPEDLLDVVVEAKWQTGEEFGDGPAARARVLEEIRRAQADIAAEARPAADGRILLHRALSLDADGLAALEPGAALGASWAFDRRGAHPYDGRRGRPTYVISAWAEPGDILGAQTLAMWSSGEGEARLSSGAAVELASIQGAGGTPARADLEGQSFGAGRPLPAGPTP